MARVRVIHGIDDLAADTRRIATTARKDMVGVVREGIRVGNSVAKDNARRSSGKHARLYPGTFTAEMKLYGGLGLIAGEYGPEDRGQGLLAMYLERGSRNNPPHNDLAKSADVIGPAFAGEVRRLPDKWFW